MSTGVFGEVLRNLSGNPTEALKDPISSAYCGAVNSFVERMDLKDPQDMKKVLEEWWELERHTTWLRSARGDWGWGYRQTILIDASRSLEKDGDAFPMVQYTVQRMLEENGSSSIEGKGRVFGNLVLLESSEPLFFSQDDTQRKKPAINYVDRMNAATDVLPTITHPIERVILKHMLAANKIAYEKSSFDQTALVKEVDLLQSMLRVASDPYGYMLSQKDRTVGSITDEIEELFRE